ncbi:MAG: thioesterase family protein [Sphingomonadales bacterium]|nr:thioesterase family protein [Sphingomonadales bacterium]
MSGFYTRSGDDFLPTGLGGSRWDAATQGGAPVAGLAAQVLGAVPTRTPMRPVRLTLDLLGAVPMAAMTPVVRVLRDGARLQLAELDMTVAGRTVLRASLLRVRGEGADEAPGAPPGRPFPDGVAPWVRAMSESIRVAGSEHEPGPGAVWMRVITPMIAGEPIDPLGALAAAADWGTYIAPPADPQAFTYPTLDLSLHLTRMPRGDWWLLEGASECAGNGAAVTRLAMSDRTGAFATALQSVFVDRRREAAP